MQTLQFQSQQPYYIQLLQKISILEGVIGPFDLSPNKIIEANELRKEWELIKKEGHFSPEEINILESVYLKNNSVPIIWQTEIPENNRKEPQSFSIKTLTDE